MILKVKEILKDGFRSTKENTALQMLSKESSIFFYLSRFFKKIIFKVFVKKQMRADLLARYLIAFKFTLMTHSGHSACTDHPFFL
jgi:hypothetical protein